MSNRSNRWIIQAFRDLRIEFGNKCAYCGTRRQLQFAHIQPTGLNGTGRGRKERYYDIVNHKDSYVLLCRKHHKEYDQGIIKL